MNRMNKKFFFVMLFFYWLLASKQLQAWEFYNKHRDKIYLSGASYIHFSQSENHQGPPVLFSAEIQKPSKLYYGLSLFNNSFGQFSQYLFVGKEFRLDQYVSGMRSKISVGLIHGYKDEYQNKIPFNDLGIAPAIIPGIGYQKKKWGFDVYLMGAAGLLFDVGYEF